MNRMDKLIKEMKEAAGDNWADLRSRFGLDDEGMMTLAAKTHYSTVEDMTAVTPLEVYQTDPQAFLTGLREANPELMEMPDDQIVSAVTGEPTDTFDGESWRKRYKEDDDPFGDWGPVVTELSIDQPTFDAIASAAGFPSSADMVATYPSPLSLPEETATAILDSIMSLVPSAQGRSPEEISFCLFGTEMNPSGGGEGEGE